MSRRTILLAVLVVLLLPWTARAQNGPQQKGILARAIHLVEEPEAKKGPFPMPFGTTPQDVDVNSTIRVRVSTDDLLAGLSGNPVLTPAAQEVATLHQSAEELKKAEIHLQRSIATLAKLLQLDMEGKRDSPEFTATAQEDQADIKALLTIFQNHLDALNASSRADFHQHATEARQRSNQAIVSAGARNTYLTFVLEEIHWTLDQLEEARKRLEADSPPLALVLSATFVRPDGVTEVALPNYNDLPPGVPKSLDKLNLALSPQQVAAQQDAAALAQTLNNVAQGSGELKKAVGQILRAQGVDLQALEDALDHVKEDAAALRGTDWRQVGDRLEDRLLAAVEDATGDERELLEGTLLPEVRTLQTRAASLRTTLAGLLATVQDLRANLSDDANPDPVARLVTLIGVAQVGSDLLSGELFRSLKAELALWSQSVHAIQSQVKELRAGLEGLPDELRGEVVAILSDSADEQLGNLLTHLGELRAAATAAAGQLRAAFDSNSDLAGIPALLAALRQAPPPDTAFRVAFRDIKDTWFDIRTLNPREEDDVVVVRAWLFRMKPSADDPAKLVEDEELDSEIQQLRLLKFGWYSTPGVGVVYMRSVNKLGPDETKKQVRAFAPQVSWLAQYRSWQKSAPDPSNPPPFRYQPSWWSSMAVGFHTLSLDLDNDNQQELGLGISLSFFNNFLQIGGGWDLSLDDEPYIFIGTRLLNVAKSLGVSEEQPAPAE